jgi:hypothetical protein
MELEAFLPAPASHVRSCTCFGYGTLKQYWAGDVLAMHDLRGGVSAAGALVISTPVASVASITCAAKKVCCRTDPASLSQGRVAHLFAAAASIRMCVVCLGCLCSVLVAQLSFPQRQSSSIQHVQQLTGWLSGSAA